MLFKTAKMVLIFYQKKFFENRNLSITIDLYKKTLKNNKIYIFINNVFSNRKTPFWTYFN